MSPACVRCQVNFANWLAGAGRGEEAIARYGLVLALDPGLIELHTNIGLALVRLGRPAEAVPTASACWRGTPSVYRHA